MKQMLTFKSQEKDFLRDYHQSSNTATLFQVMKHDPEQGKMVDGELLNVIPNLLLVFGVFSNSLQFCYLNHHFPHRGG